MKSLPIVAAILGLAVTAALVAIFGARAVIGSLLAIGWGGFGAICLVHLGLIAAMGIAWRCLVPHGGIWVFPAARLLRDAGSEALPLSTIGGCVLGARALTLAEMSGAVAAASTIVDLTLEFFGKIAYTALGLAWLVHLRPGSPLTVPVAIGLALAVGFGLAFVVVQRRGSGLGRRLAQRLGRGWAERTAAGAAALDEALGRIWSYRAGLRSGFLLHFVCWVAGTCEAWLFLRLTHRAWPFATVLVIESLLYAIRTFAFAIPSAVGVQEGAYVLVGGAFGLTPETALALSLVKRARDLTLGLPTLGVWQIVEGRRLWRRRRCALARRKP